jgi:ribonuclease inhibitor
MKSITIDCSKIKSEKDFHEAFGSLEVTPDYYGNNLNALWDVLSTDIEGPVEFVFQNHKDFELANKDVYKKVMGVFNDAVSECPGELVITLS